MTFALEPLRDLESCRSEWVSLAERSGNIFSTWEWAESWWRHFGRGRSLRLLAARRPDRSTAAIIPLYEARRHPLRIGRLLGHGVADKLGPVSAPEERRPVTRVLATAGETALLDLVTAERLSASDLRESSTGSHIVRRESSPVLTIEGRSWEDFLAARSSNFRQQVRRRERRMRREFGLTFRLTETARELDSDFDTLLDLHAARWGRASSAFSPAPAPSIASSPFVPSNKAGCGYGRPMRLAPPLRLGTGFASAARNGTTRPVETRRGSVKRSASSS